jgi:hypothetical protein
MRDPEMAARAGYAAARLEQAWQRWRARHGLGGPSDPLASYVGYSQKEPMGQPRVVIGVDAAEAEYFADFLESHECAGVARIGPQPVDGMPHLSAGGSAPAPRDVPSELTVCMADAADPGALTGAERAVMTGPGPWPASATRDFHQFPVVPDHPHGPSDPLAAELAGWMSGELPGQASEQLATWGAAEPAAYPAMDRPRSGC